MRIFKHPGLALLMFAPRLLGADYPVQPVPFAAVRVTGGFWHARQEVNRAVTVPFALKQCEDTGRIRNFDLAGRWCMAWRIPRRNFRRPG